MRMLRLPLGRSQQCGQYMDGNAALFAELGEHKLCGGIGAVGLMTSGAPIGEGQEVFELHLGRGALGAGEAVGDLNEDLGQLCNRGGVKIGKGLVAVVELAQGPANDADGSADKAFSGEVVTKGGGAQAHIDHVPIGDG